MLVNDASSGYFIFLLKKVKFSVSSQTLDGAKSGVFGQTQGAFKMMQKEQLTSIQNLWYCMVTSQAANHFLPQNQN